LADAKLTAVRQKGTYHLRFANVDDRLTLWVDGRLPFGDGVVYDEPRDQGPTANDLEPASIGVKGGTVVVRKLRLHRDAYYTINPNRGADHNGIEDWSDPERWESLRKLPGLTLYVQPGHYLCLGDNSPASSDGREWGLVPERLLLGRAMVVYYPFYFPVWPLEAPVNRIRLIE
jgi:signal peptidase I